MPGNEQEDQTMTTVYYSAYEREGSHRYKLVLDATYDTYDLADNEWHEDIAIACAEDWHSNYDGWEAVWPRVFTLYASKDGPPLARMDVELEMAPSFAATPAPSGGKQ